MLSPCEEAGGVFESIWREKKYYSYGSIIKDVEYEKKKKKKNGLIVKPKRPEEEGQKLTDDVTFFEHCYSWRPIQHFNQQLESIPKLAVQEAKEESSPKRYVRLKVYKLCY